MANKAEKPLYMLAHTKLFHRRAGTIHLITFIKYIYTFLEIHQNQILLMTVSNLFNQIYASESDITF